MDSKTVELTANDNTAYSFIWLDTEKGPLVDARMKKILTDAANIGAVDRAGDRLQNARKGYLLLFRQPVASTLLRRL